MKRMFTIALLVFVLLSMIQKMREVQAQATCTGCYVKGDGCRGCDVLFTSGWLNCWAVCDVCEAWGICNLGGFASHTNQSKITKKQEVNLIQENHSFASFTSFLRSEAWLPVTLETPSTQSQEDCSGVTTNIRFEKDHILKLAEKDLTLAFVVARTQIHSKPIGEDVMVKWTPVEITKDDLNSLLKNDQAWLQQYSERARQLGRSGAEAEFKIRIDRAGNNQLRYTITKMKGANSNSNVSQASFELTPNSQLGGYVSIRCLF